MNQLAIPLLLSLLTGCATVTPNYDAKFGDALRTAKHDMMINPDAGKNPDPASGMDGNAAREAITQYQGTFKTPPPAINVINIGGSLSK